MTVEELIAMEPGELVVIKKRSEVDNPVERVAYLDDMAAYAGGIFVTTKSKIGSPDAGYAATELKDENGNPIPYWWYSSFLDKYVDISAFKEEASDEELEAMLSAF